MRHCREPMFALRTGLDIERAWSFVKQCIKERNEFRVQAKSAFILVADCVLHAHCKRGTGSGVMQNLLSIPFLFLLGISASLAATDAPPNAIVTSGTKDIQTVRLIGKTDEYRHPIFGSMAEATGIEVLTHEGKTLRYKAERNSVFEDREVRLADLDGDGHDEMIVVHTYFSKGASLAIFAIENGEIKLKAETPPLGGPHRWLNPAGIANFLGETGQQIALVKMPHAVGQLQLWSYHDGKLRLERTVEDVSNHKFGSQNRYLAAVAAVSSAGSTDLVIPSFDRRNVRIISFDKIVQTRSVSVGAEISENAVVKKKDFPAIVQWKLSDGKLFILQNSN
jgi:hypothetical protein